MTDLDLLDIDSLLSDGEKAVRDKVRSFVDAEVLPHVSEWFEDQAWPAHLPVELGKLQLLGMHLTGNGLPGSGAVEYGLACMELEAGDAGVRTFASVQGSLAMYAIHRFGSAQQKERWLPRLASGEAVGCFALTEREAGSDPSAMTVTATPDGDGWIITGTKRWVTSGSIADVAIVWAKTPDGIQGFAVDREAPGFAAEDIAGKMSLRASVTSDLFFDNCRVGADALLAEAKGLRAALACLNEARYGIVWGSIGAARACLEAAVDHAGARISFGKPIGAFQMTQQRLVDMAVAVNRGMLLALHLGRLKDSGRITPQQVSFGKLVNVREAQAVAREARALLGAEGITLGTPVIRHMNNLESVATYEGTAEVHALVLGEAITGHKAFS